VGEWRAYPGALGETCLHLCVDTQRLFREETDWHTPWLARVLPRVERLVAAHPARTILTRFIPAQHPGEGRGTWSGYSRRWASMTLDRLEPRRRSRARTRALCAAGRDLRQGGLFAVARHRPQ
jgi:nicotinamidase-related amidase